MTKFKLGDHVRIIAPHSEWFDRTGTVKAIWHASGEPCPEFQVDGIDGLPLWFSPHELILADPHHEMINDPEGQRLVQAIHDRKEQK